MLHRLDKTFVIAKIINKKWKNIYEDTCWPRWQWCKMSLFIPSFKQKHQQFKTIDGFSRRWIQDDVLWRDLLILLCIIKRDLIKHAKLLDLLPTVSMHLTCSGICILNRRSRSHPGVSDVLGECVLFILALPCQGPPCLGTLGMSSGWEDVDSVQKMPARVFSVPGWLRSKDCSPLETASTKISSACLFEDV